MTTLRARVFIIFSVFFLFVLAVSIILIVLSKQKEAAVEMPTTTPEAIDSSNFTPDKITAPAAQITPSAGMTVKQPTTEEQMQNAAKQMAKIFVERYGTYSTDNLSTNIREVETMCSPDLWKVLSQRITATQPATSFIGMTTQAVASVITNWQADKAVVEISTIRTETKNGNTASKNQKATVTLIKIQDNWLVDDIKWN